MGKYHESVGGHSVTVKDGDHASGSNKADVYISGSGEKDHCHLWVDKDGNSGTVHRGQCDECSESSSSGGK